MNEFTTYGKLTNILFEKCLEIGPNSLAYCACPNFGANLRMNCAMNSWKVVSTRTNCLLEIGSVVEATELTTSNSIVSFLSQSCHFFSFFVIFGHCLYIGLRGFRDNHCTNNILYFFFLLYIYIYFIIYFFFFCEFSMVAVFELWR